MSRVFSSRFIQQVSFTLRGIIINCGGFMNMQIQIGWECIRVVFPSAVLFFCFQDSTKCGFQIALWLFNFLAFRMYPYGAYVKPYVIQAIGIHCADCRLIEIKIWRCRVHSAHKFATLLYNIPCIPHIFQLNRESSKEGNTHIINCVRIWNEIEIESSRKLATCACTRRALEFLAFLFLPAHEMPLTKETTKNLCTFLPRRKWIIRILFAAKSLDSAPLQRRKHTRPNEREKKIEWSLCVFFVVDYFW